MTEKESSGSQTLVRGLKLLELLSQYPNGCPLAQLSELAQLNKSTVHRLLQSLQQEGFVRPAPTTGSYRLTTKCLAIGQRALSSLNILHIAAPHLEALNLELGETVNFAMREGNHAILIYKLEPTTGMMKTRAYIGQRLQLYCSGMGKLFLAYDKPEYIPQYWQQKHNVIRQLTANTITTIPEMETELAKIRQQQFAMDDEENELGVSCIACPVFDNQGKANYAVSISLSTARLSQLGFNILYPALRITAQKISEELGWHAE
ncbi:transcriptional regulator, IclR family, C-terminal domain protein [Actinobacillus ureae ATCC 25976]|uniref:Transcriptional regulator, IclR family, C-terminal domain protein n=1 Tax=Actinobacillus ureae ATCC 25976 TaxID=887324 RepID=E8KJ61_9PAST|nr:IclR family transcriptional regulator [Actinobacillus ureae]EFX91073.1 transcriptional regulator, IclR family, C-terminal domain protein [Actinobacillus ureae ATCC 25976]